MNSMIKLVFTFSATALFAFNISAGNDKAPRTVEGPFLVPVLRENDKGGAGKGSDGYHAVKNALLLCEMPNEPKDKIEETKAKLKDPKLVEQLFLYSTSTWKSAIIAKRQNIFAHDYVYDNLLCSLLGCETIKTQEFIEFTPSLPDSTPLKTVNKIAHFNEINEKLRSARETIISNLELITSSLLSKAIIHYNENKKHYTISKDLIFNTIVSELKLIDLETAETLFASIHDLNFVVENDNILSENEIIRKRNYLDTTNKKTVIEPGNCLSEDEIRFLFEQELSKETDSFVSSRKDINYFFINNELSEKDFLKRMEECSQKINEYETLGTTGIIVIFLRNQGSWSVTVVKKQKESLQYFIADSTVKNVPHEPLTKPTKIPNYPQPISISSDDEKKSEVFFKQSAVSREHYAGSLPQPVEDIIDILNNSQIYRDMGLTSLPTMMLLYGPPGTGKTTLAKLIAHETGRLYTEVVASSLLNKYYGEGVKQLRKIFEVAREQGRPTIIFIDEIDAILATTTNENQRTDLLQVLNHELDQKDANIFVIGATNKYALIDGTTKSRCRNYCLEVPLPNFKNRETVIKHYLQKIAIDDDKLIQHLAKSTDKFSCRDLESLINQAIIQAKKSGFRSVSAKHLTLALLKTRDEIAKAKKEEDKKNPIINYKELLKSTIHQVTGSLATTAIIFTVTGIWGYYFPKPANTTTNK